MAGHNKWSKIKHKKAITDKQKSQKFAKLVRQIQVAAKKCGGDTTNPELRAAINKAKRENMPISNIENAIKKASEVKDLSPVIFETYGPGGVSIIITALTDNNNRTSSEIKHLLSKHGLSLATPGSAMWNFQKDTETNDYIPQTKLTLSDQDLSKLENIIDALQEHDDVQNIYTNAEQLCE